MKLIKMARVHFCFCCYFHYLLLKAGFFPKTGGRIHNFAQSYLTNCLQLWNVYFFKEMDRLLDLTLFDEFQYFGSPEHFWFWTYSFLIAGARYHKQITNYVNSYFTI